MRKTANAAFLLAALAGVAVACGKSPSPAAPTPSPVPTATPTPAPAPPPVPSPSPTPDVNDTPPARLSLRLYTIEDGQGGFSNDPNPSEPIPVEAIARIDVIGKDPDNRETTGIGPLEFFFSNSRLVKVTGNHTHQRRLEVLLPGVLDCWVTQDGVTSNTLTLHFRAK